MQSTVCQLLLDWSFSPVSAFSGSTFLGSESPCTLKTFSSDSPPGFGSNSNRMVNDSVLAEEKEKEEGGGMTKEEDEEEREAQELREWNAKNGTGSDGTGGGGGNIKSKEEWLKASKERREAQEALEGPINTHTNLDVCFLCAKPATSVCEVHPIFLRKPLLEECLL